MSAEIKALIKRYEELQKAIRDTPEGDALDKLWDEFDIVGGELHESKDGFFYLYGF